MSQQTLQTGRPVPSTEDWQSLADSLGLNTGENARPKDMKRVEQKAWALLQPRLSKLDVHEVRSILLLLDHVGIMKDVLLATALKSKPASASKAREVVHLLSLVLQVTDSLNLTVLRFFSDHSEALSPFNLGLPIAVVFRLFDAQIPLRSVWDTSSLFKDSRQQLSKQDAIALAQVRRFIHEEAGAPTPKTQSELVDDLQAQLWIDTELRFGSAAEIKKSLTTALGEWEANSGDQNSSPSGLVCSAYLADKLRAASAEMERAVFRHLVVYGEPGSGKMSLVDLLKDTDQRSIVVTLEETFDSKNLVGTYVCNETGEFVFKKGPLTVAAEEGMWLVLRGVEQAPPDLLSFLLPLVQDNQLEVSSTFSIKPKLGFRMIAICQGDPSDEHLQPLKTTSVAPFLAELSAVTLKPLEGREDFKEILQTKFPYLTSIPWLANFVLEAKDFLDSKLASFKGQLLDHKPFSVKQLFRVCQRINSILSSIVDLEHPGSLFLSSATARDILTDMVDVFLAYLYDKRIKTILVSALVVEVFNPACLQNSQTQIDPQELVDYLLEQTRDFGISQHSHYFGRAKPVEIANPEVQSEDFVFTSTTLRLVEQVSVALEHHESVLLVGETGTGKTTAVQELAKLRGKRLHVFNLNQNTDSSDLLGGFKPVDIKFLMKPTYGLFLGLFRRLFPADKNRTFLELAQKCYEANQLKEFIQCLNHALKALKGNKKSTDQDKEEIAKLEHMTKDLDKRSKKLDSGGGFIFQFIEGQLIKCLQEGDWILLDEVNLASDSVLNRLANIIEGNHILLNERADIVETQRHTDFRIFMCMNPPYTSAGKKSLPPTLRRRLTEVYVPELEKETDLLPIVNRGAPAQLFTDEMRRQILAFYLKARTVTQGTGHKGPSVGLRNLSRSLKMMRKAVLMKYPVLKAVYEGLFTCFASHLTLSQQGELHRLICSLFAIKQLPTLQALAQASNSETVAHVGDSLIKKGAYPPSHFDERDFVLTPTFQSLVKRLASIVAITDFAIILEGPTSAGKTSTVQYLANVTHNKVIRINNHMHTDIQEYLGSYVPSTDSAEGKLVFQEGVLVEAVRNGYWVILDELNLAPSEVLEALNRLLDDNRELHIVETQTVVKAHPNFRIFATQNPTEGYGGRKELSEAFKNRFIMIKVGDVPSADLQQILETKCQLPQSRATLMIKAMENLQIYRSTSSLFAGKNSIITVRDLLKWGGRVNHQMESLSQAEIALEGFLVLGERSRSPEDKEFIRKTLETTFKCKIDVDGYYKEYFEKQGLAQTFAQAHSQKLIVTEQLRRLAVLVHKCLRNKEPVLLVGETGVGKTTLCQVFAALNKQELFSINCHQNTETSDFIGCMRTRKNIEQTQQDLQAMMDKHLPLLSEEQQQKFADLKGLKAQASFMSKSLKAAGKENPEAKTAYKEVNSLKNELSVVFEWTDGILVEAMRSGGLLLIDEISLANDSVLERLNSVFEAERLLVLSERSSAEAIKIVAKDGFNIVATMNPSGDFGKKELSPALRNRMTEIWVESYFLQPSLLTLYAEAPAQPVFNQLSEAVDLYKITLELAKDKLALTPDQQVVVAGTIFNVIGFVSFVLAKRFSALQRRALSVRDIINMIDFVRVALPLFEQEAHVSQLAMSIYHSVSLVILDGLCLGIDVAGDKQKEQIFSQCSEYLHEVLRTLCCPQWAGKEHSSEFVNTPTEIGVQPFLLPKKEGSQASLFTFQAATTRSNLERLLRAFQLQKPILIEGPPGVGKTSLIENLARLSGRKLTRVNLSEQTDMMDLLGSEYPTASSSEDQTDDVQFKWCDGVLLRAIKEGHWFLIDEMNLAQQSVLEGLNAILDHRRTVYIPELNKEFQCHPDFYVFACQNPSQSSSSVGGRKTLPKSFLNRFNKIYLEELTQADYTCILGLAVSRDPALSHLQVDKLLEASQKIEAAAKTAYSADEGSVNLRDLNRLLKLYKKFMTETGGQHDLSLAQALNIQYLERFAERDQGVEVLCEIVRDTDLVENIDTVKAVLEAWPLARIQPGNTVEFIGPKPAKIEGCQVAVRNSHLLLSHLQSLQGAHTRSIQFLVEALQANFPILVVSDDCPRFSADLQTLSRLSNKKLNRLLLNDRSDTTQLLGCFEQTQVGFSSLAKELGDELLRGNHVAENIRLQHLLSGVRCEEERGEVLTAFIRACDAFDVSEQQRWEGRYNSCKATAKSGQSRFEWVDSVLVRAIEQGEWVVFENANLCNPSILDRLNSLLEEGNCTLSINEQGLIEGNQLREVHAHPDFRAIFVISKATFVDQGRDVSRALRNRCLALNMFYGCPLSENSWAQGIFEDSESLHSDLSSVKILDLLHESLKEDFYPVNEASPVQTEQAVALGKRPSPELAPASAPRGSLANYLYCLLSKRELPREVWELYMKQSEESSLCASTWEKKPADWFAWAMQCKGASLSAKIKSSLKAQKQKVLLTNQAQRLLHLATAPAEAKNSLEEILDKVTLLQFIHEELCQNSRAECLQSQFAVFMLGSGHSEEQFGEAVTRALQQGRTGGLALEQVELLTPNKLSPLDIETIDKAVQKAEDANQRPMGSVWVQAVGQEVTSLQGLSALKQMFTVIVMNDDKEILNLEEVDEDSVAEMFFESSPSLVLMPKNPATFIASKSSLYKSLSFFEDQASLLPSGSLTAQSDRLSLIHPSLSRSSFQSRFPYWLGLFTLEKAYNFPRPVEIVTMDRVLSDENIHLNLRDLPAFFASATGLLSQMNNSLNSESEIKDAFLKEAASFVSNSEDLKAIEELGEIENSLNEVKDIINDEAHDPTFEILSSLIRTFEHMEVERIIEALLVLPHEHARLVATTELWEEDGYKGEVSYGLYKLRNVQASLDSASAFETKVEELKTKSAQLKKLLPAAQLHSQLPNLLRYVKQLEGSVASLISGLKEIDQQNLGMKCQLLIQQLETGFNMYYTRFNHIIDPMLHGALLITGCVRFLLQDLSKLAFNATSITDLTSLKSFQTEAVISGKTAARSHSESGRMIYQQTLLQMIKLQRLLGDRSPTKDAGLVRSHALDYFLRQVIAKKLAEEEEMDKAEEQVLRLPFKMKVQSIMDDNKAIDELTAKDKERMEIEAQQEIEVNFPSYFDEFQTHLLENKGEPVKRVNHLDLLSEMQPHHEVKAEKVIAELAEVTLASESEYKTEFMRQRLELVQMCNEENETLKSKTGGPFASSLICSAHERDREWMEDAVCCLSDQLEQAQLKSVMNISELQLPSTFNFYHDAIPQEARLIYAPLAKLQQRVCNIITEYESPILNDVLFLANYMMTTFNTKETPLMKMLTGMELLLEKLGEWESYASKKLNSCEEEMNYVKQLIIRYRKIQILSWRNLLNHRRLKMIRDDYSNCIRLLHTVEKQIFDTSSYRQKRAANSSKNLPTQSKSLQIFEIVDLFIRDSSLGLFESRLSVLQMLYDGLTQKQTFLKGDPRAASLETRKLLSVQRYTDTMKELVLTRLGEVLNILHFTLRYYGQFRDKLQRTTARLDAQAREKIKVLIDVSKWSVQKFTQVKNNIDKTHRQLNRACKQEEEILMQNIQSLVLTSSRKKYIRTDAGGDGLLSLDGERSQLVSSVHTSLFGVGVKGPIAQSAMVKQLDYFLKTQIAPRWPDVLCLESTMAGMFDRLKSVRDINKKNFQRRAFIDLLKFMKDQGLRPNFQDKLQPHLLKSKLVEVDASELNEKLSKYFYRSQELLIITEASSQVDENADLKNIDILRIKGFTSSLVSQIYKLNEQLGNLSSSVTSLKEVSAQAPSVSVDSELALTAQKNKTFRTISKEFFDLRSRVHERLNIIAIMEKNPVENYRDSEQPYLSLCKANFEALQKDVEDFETELVPQAASTSSRRTQKLAALALTSVRQIKEQLLQFQEEGPSSEEVSPAVKKRSNLILKSAKLFYQDVYTLLKDCREEGWLHKRKESQESTTAVSVEVPQQQVEEADEQPELDIVEQHAFTQRLVERLCPGGASKLAKGVSASSQIELLTKIEATAKKLFTFEGATEALSLGDVKTLNESKEVFQKVIETVDFILSAQTTFLASLCKFSYLTQRIFLYLIYQGFCGQDDKEPEDQEQKEKDDQYLDADGCGMGDGQGENNVSNEIEHEEQLEGLKNYESEEEQQQEQQEKQEQNKDEEEEGKDNDFEMQEDFDGDMEDDQPKEDEEKKDEEDKEDDALDKVDDMLDNQLWNQNMEDMEQKEDEAGENDDQQEKDEIDLGDRELDKQNQVENKDKEMTAGDHDKQDKEEDKPDEAPGDDDDVEIQKEEQSAKDEDEQAPEDDEDQETQKGDDIPLDRDELIEEDEKQEDDPEQQAAPEEDMDGAQSQEDDEHPPSEGEDKDREEDEDMEKDDAELDKDQEMQDEEPNNDDKGSVDDKGADDKDLADDQAPAGDEENDEENQEQAAVKKETGDNNLNEQQQNQQNQSKDNAADNLQTQFDVDGGDILFELAQMINEQQRQKDQRQQQQQKKQQQPVQFDDTKKQVEDPNLAENKEDRPNKPEAQPEDAGGLEYELDSEADQMQGRMAADQMAEQKQDEVVDKEMEPEEGDDYKMESDDDDEGKVQKTSEEVKEAKDLPKPKDHKPKDEKPIAETKKEESDEAEEQIDTADLLADYNDFLKNKNKENMDIDEEYKIKEEDQVEERPELQLAKESLLEEFDYQDEKRQIIDLLHSWQQDSDLYAQSMALLGKFKNETSSASASLCEQLRIVLEPQLSQQLQGDFRTGKRLNMKKVISFIASHYRNDKIWLRRTLPSKRDYKILIAIDDSLSMKEQNLGFFSLESLVTLIEGLARLEVGKVAVARIRNRMELLNSFEDPYSSERSAFIISQFNFEHCEQRSHDFAMANFVKDANKLLDVQNTMSQSRGLSSCPFVIILSDGRFNKDNVRKHMQEATDKKYLYIFVILDAQKESKGILGLRSAHREPNGRGGSSMKLVPYLQDFPFAYYLIINNLELLPSALSQILVQWYAMN